MITNHHAQPPREWAVTHFSGAELSDVRRVERAITIGEAMAASPGASLPQMFARRSDLKAAYEFFKHPEATPDRVQAGHREQVLCALAQPGTYLLLEDTTELAWTTRQPIAGLGPVGSSKAKQIGFHLHSVLAVRWPDEVAAGSAPQRPGVEILGLADQQFYVRQPRPAGRAKAPSARRGRGAQVLESDLWERAAQRLGTAPESDAVCWIKVCDRAADIYDHVRACQHQGQSYIIRANQDRVLVDGAGERRGKLFPTVRESPSLGELAVELRARPKQAARTARVAVSVTEVCVRAPQVRGLAAGERTPLSCRVVRVWEATPPAGVTALEWVLLTDLEVETLAQASLIAQQYATRWVEEEFHKALKTGMQAEALQLETAPQLFVAIALQSVVALRLLDLRERLRSTPQAPASAAGLSKLELEVLRARSEQPVETVQAVALALGRLGGHLNRKGDGPPGWITLWRGWVVLQTLVEGVSLARKLHKFG